jgi:hypothetical protein
MKPRDAEKSAGQALRDCLRDVPFLRLEDIQHHPEQKDTGADLSARLKTPEGERRIFIVFERSGEPRFAHDAVNKLLRRRWREGDSDADAWLVFVAPYVSPRAAEICSQEGVGYVDLAGNCRLSFSSVFVERQGKPNPFAQKRDLRSLYSPKAARVLRMLLSDPWREWKVVDLAREADVSLGQVSNVKKLLSDREWLRDEASGVSLADPQALLLEWASTDMRSSRPEVHDFYSFDKPGQVEQRLAEVCERMDVPYALTEFSGAARFAPIVRYQRASAYVTDRVEEVAESLGLKRVPDGANVRLLQPKDSGVLIDSSDRGGVRVASPVQMYLDLIRVPGRGEEAAEAVLENVIRPMWDLSASPTERE